MQEKYQGMQIEDVKKIIIVLDSNIKTNEKIDLKLDSLKDNINEAYKSSLNSKQINKINKEISNSHYVKIRNTKSYKNYIEKKIYEYINTGKEASKKPINLSNKKA